MVYRVGNTEKLEEGQEGVRGQPRPPQVGWHMLGSLSVLWKRRHKGQGLKVSTVSQALPGTGTAAYASASWPKHTVWDSLASGSLDNTYSSSLLAFLARENSSQVPSGNGRVGYPAKQFPNFCN